MRFSRVVHLESGKFNLNKLQGKTARRTRKAWALFMLAAGLPEPKGGATKVHACFFKQIKK
jgi:hypothetical protein